MPCPHCKITIIKRSNNESAVSAAAYQSGEKLFSEYDQEQKYYLKERQRDFMPEDTKAGMIQAFLDSYPGDTVCSKQLYKEALNHDFDEPKQWEITLLLYVIFD